MWNSLLLFALTCGAQQLSKRLTNQDVIELVVVGLPDDVIIDKINATERTRKLERWHKSLESECIPPLTPLTVEDACRLIQSYVDRYNAVCLHSAIGYVTPQDMLHGRQAEIHAARDRKLEEARRQRQLRRRPADYSGLVQSPLSLPAT
jgi:hypothetical protein